MSSTRKEKIKLVAIPLEDEVELESDKCVAQAGPSIERWEQHKENIQPIRQGRKIETLMGALTLVSDLKSQSDLIKSHKDKLDNDLKENADDPNQQLSIWQHYIDTLEQIIPDGGKVSGVTNAIESCIEIYYDKKEFKQDERLLDIFMKFLRFCDEPIEVFGFMYANSICTLQSGLYLNWSWQYEIRKNVRKAQDLLKLGIKNLASPREVLEEALVQLNSRIDRMIQLGQLDDISDSTTTNSRDIQAKLESDGIRAALQTLKFSYSKKKGVTVPVTRIGSAIDWGNAGGLKNQTKVVNGLRVPKKPIAKKSNRPVEILTEEPTVGSENEGVNVFKDKIPTSQRIQQVGKRGDENQAPRLGIISQAGLTQRR